MNRLNTEIEDGKKVVKGFGGFEENEDKGMLYFNFHGEYVSMGYMELFDYGVSILMASMGFIILEKHKMHHLYYHKDLEIYFYWDGVGKKHKKWVFSYDGRHHGYFYPHFFKKDERIRHREDGSVCGLYRPYTDEYVVVMLNCILETYRHFWKNRKKGKSTCGNEFDFLKAERWTGKWDYSHCKAYFVNQEGLTLRNAEYHPAGTDLPVEIAHSVKYFDFIHHKTWSGYVRGENS